MGKEWHWSRPSRKEEKEEMPGCMGGMVHFFDFHQLLFNASTCTRPQEAASPGSPPQNKHNSAQFMKDLEAPRNSLELDEAAAAKASTSAVGDDYYDDIPYGVPLAPMPSPVRSKKELRLWVEEEKRISSQAVTPRTTNVVARLMGLETEPDELFYTPTAGSQSASLQHSPKVNTTNKKKTKKNSIELPPPPPRQPLQKRDCNVPSHAAATGFRSLPETPRASSERYRDADPRLSLQLNKENHSNHSLPPPPSHYVTTNYRRKDTLKVQDEVKAPRNRYYAKEIVKQVKESINRRENSTFNGIHGDEVLKSGRTTMAAERNASAKIESQSFTAKPSPSRSPPPLDRRFPWSPEFSIPKPSPSTSLATPLSSSRGYSDRSGNKTGSSKCQKVSYERYTERIKRHTPQPPTALRNFPEVPNSYTRKEASHQRQPKIGVHPSCTLATQEHKMLNVGSQKSNSQWRRKLAKEHDPEFHYVRSVLERAGVMMGGTSRVSWFSPSLPIDPSVFHRLELDLPLFLFGPIRHRCNRKLLFHLVEEILGELMGWSTTCSISNNEMLLEKLWSQIRSFPSADCKVIGDIDVLVSADLAEGKVKRLLQNPSVVAEAEYVALEIERDVLDAIVGEAADSLSYSFAQNNAGESCHF